MWWCMKERRGWCFHIQAIAAETNSVHVHEACLWFCCCFSYDSQSLWCLKAIVWLTFEILLRLTRVSCQAFNKMYESAHTLTEEGWINSCTPSICMAQMSFCSLPEDKMLPCACLKAANAHLYSAILQTLTHGFVRCYLRCFEIRQTLAWGWKYHKQTAGKNKVVCTDIWEALIKGLVLVPNNQCSCNSKKKKKRKTISILCFQISRMTFDFKHNWNK